MSKSYDIQGELQAIADHQADNCFIAEYVLKTPKRERQEEGLGIALAQWAGWDGLTLMRIFASSLTDANFHAEAEQVQEMIERIESYG